jgi:hypothetical protein
MSCWLQALLTAAALALVASDECSVTPVIHVLQYPGCVPKPIPSFACTGRCTSYLQVGTLKIYPHIFVKCNQENYFLCQPKMRKDNVRPHSLANLTQHFELEKNYGSFFQFITM